MNRNDKKSGGKKTFVMFLYACGVSRLHQEFELFEQEKKQKKTIILKKSVFESYFDETS